MSMTRVVSKSDCSHMIFSLRRFQKLGTIKIRAEDNPYLMVSFCGNNGVSDKWNVKVFKYNEKKCGHSIVTNDWHVLDAIISGEKNALKKSDKAVISMDDSGWGFPLGGVLVGASDEKSFYFDEVPVKFFKDGVMKSRKYLRDYRDKGLALLSKFNATPETHRIEICTGFVNTDLKDALRIKGYEVHVVEIKGMLQDTLEDKHKQYVAALIGKDMYYDPKDMDMSDIPREYNRCLAFGLKHCPALLKTGWKSIRTKEVSRG